MKTLKSLLTLAALLSLCSSSHAVSVVGGPIYNPANGHNYYLLSAGTWNQAEAFSQTLGGHLVSISDATENAWVYSSFINGHPDLNPWTGLNDLSAPNNWQWSSGEAVTFLNFAPGEPNQIGPWPYGVNIFPSNPYPTFAGQWNDAPTVDVVQGIAEVPEPSTMSLALLAIGGLIARRVRRQNQK